MYWPDNKLVYLGILFKDEVNVKTCWYLETELPTIFIIAAS